MNAKCKQIMLEKKKSTKEHEIDKKLRENVFDPINSILKHKDRNKIKVMVRVT